MTGYAMAVSEIRGEINGKTVSKQNSKDVMSSLTLETTKRKLTDWLLKQRELPCLFQVLSLQEAES